MKLKLVMCAVAVLLIPAAFAFAAKRVDSKTSLNLGPRPGEFTGAVRADDPGCVSGRSVVVKRVDGSDYVAVMKDFSDINGLWGKVTEERSGSWFAKLKP